MPLPFKTSKKLIWLAASFSVPFLLWFVSGIISFIACTNANKHGIIYSKECYTNPFPDGFLHSIVCGTGGLITGVILLVVIAILIRCLKQSPLHDRIKLGFESNTIWQNNESKMIWLIASFCVPFIMLGTLGSFALWCDDISKPYDTDSKMAWDCFISFFIGGFFFGIRGLATGIIVLVLRLIIEKLVYCLKQRR